MAMAKPVAWEHFCPQMKGRLFSQSGQGWAELALPGCWECHSTLVSQLGSAAGLEGKACPTVSVSGGVGAHQDLSMSGAASTTVWYVASH